MRPPALPAAPKEYSRQYLDTLLRILTQYLTVEDSSKANYNGAYDQDFTAAKVYLGTGGVFWSSGAGTPEAVVTAPVGSLFTRTDGGATTTLYVKTSGVGNTGWTAK